MSRRRVAVLVALGAVALTASYPPFSIPGLSFVALAPAVLLLRWAEPETAGAPAFAWGFWYGVATHGLALYWLVVALWHFTPLSALGYAATITIIGLWIGAMFWFVVRVRRHASRLPLWIVLPIAWTTVEWVIGHEGDISFPWLGLGTSLTESPVLVQWADVAGARGVTLWLAWTATMLVAALTPLATRRLAAWRSLVRYGGPVLLSLVAALAYGSWRMRAVSLRPLAVVGLIQPNEGFREKWEQQRADSVVGHLVQLSTALEAQTALALFVWPEAALPGYLQMQPAWDDTIAAFARRSGTPVLTGGLWAVIRGPRDYDYYNAAIFFDTAGVWRTHPVYAKHYLVPVVERVPFVPPRWFGNLRFFGGFSRGRGLPLYEAGFGTFGVLVCYESAFEDLARRYRAAGADMLVNITNDAWFGRTSAPYQHAAHLVMRAIETRMGIARAANSGISELVDPLGRVYAATGLGAQAAVAATVITSDVETLYTRWGDWVGRLSVLATLTLGGLLLTTWRRRAGAASERGDAS